MLTMVIVIAGCPKDRDISKPATTVSSAKSSSKKKPSTRIVQVAVGSRHACLLDARGAVYCWGYNSHRALGMSDPIQRTAPTSAVKLPTAKRVAAGGHYTCALTGKSELHCWGTPPVGVAHAPKKIVTAGPVADIEVGSNHLCAVLTDGRAQCWGNNEHGQLGDGSNDQAKAPVLVRGLNDAVEIAAGAKHTCIRRATGAIVCLGRNDQGQIGDGTKDDHATLTAASGITNAVALASDRNHTCAALKDGQVLCWGQNFRGAVAQRRDFVSTTPTAIAGIGNMVDVAVGRAHSCARRKSGSVLCWGDGGDGELGRPFSMKLKHPFTISGGASPAAIEGLEGVEQMDATDSYSCAVSGGGRTAHCWGKADYGTLGNGTSAHILQPREVNGLKDASEMVVGMGFTCVRQSNGEVICWGQGGGGIRTNSGRKGTRIRDRYPPTRVASSASALFGGRKIIAHRAANKETWLWLGGLISAPDWLDQNREWEPGPITGLADVIDMDGGGNNEGYHWAVVRGGQLVSIRFAKGGFLDAPPRVAEIRKVSGFNDVAKVSGTHTRVCAVRDSGKVACFDRPPQADFNDPVNAGPMTVSGMELEGIDDAIAIAQWDRTGCVAHKSGKLSCWPKTPRGTVPKARVVNGVSEVVDVAIGGFSPSTRCAVQRSGTLWCWGRTMYDQPLFATGKTTAPANPTRTSVDDALRVGLSSSHGCVLRRNGRVSCWGRNNSDAVGASDPPNAWVPVQVNVAGISRRHVP